MRNYNYGKIVDLVKKTKIELELLYHDNWNNGIDYYKLTVSPKYVYFAAISSHYEQIVLLWVKRESDGSKVTSRHNQNKPEKKSVKAYAKKRLLNAPKLGAFFFCDFLRRCFTVFKK